MSYDGLGEQVTRWSWRGVHCSPNDGPQPKNLATGVSTDAKYIRAPANNNFLFKRHRWLTSNIDKQTNSRAGYGFLYFQTRHVGSSRHHIERLPGFGVREPVTRQGHKRVLTYHADTLPDILLNFGFPTGRPQRWNRGNKMR